MKRTKKGFTLIELLVVIAIIGLLATLSVVALNNARERARDSRRISDIKQIQTALELYYNEEDGYPVLETKGNITGISVALSAYLTLPVAPTPADGDCVDAVATGSNKGNTYSYQSADGTTYTINYCLGNDTGGIKGGVDQAATPLSSFSVAAD